MTDLEAGPSGALGRQKYRLPELFAAGDLDVHGVESRKIDQTRQQMNPERGPGRQRYRIIPALGDDDRFHGSASRRIAINQGNILHDRGRGWVVENFHEKKFLGHLEIIKASLGADGNL